MSVPLHILDAMAAAGCTLDQVLAVIRADLQERARRRELRRLARLGMNEHDSGVMNERASVARSGPPDMNEHDSGVVAGGPAEPTEEIVYGNRKTVARQAILARLDLRPAARLVLAQLVDHHNLRTGRCDPSIGRLARLAGVSARSASRAIAELQDADLVRVVIHGGYSHRNAYLINWRALGRLPAAGAAGAARAKMNDHDSGATTTLVSADHDSRVIQTLSQNLDSDSGGGGDRARVDAVAEAERRSRAGALQPAQRELRLMRVLPGGRSKADNAWGAASARIWEAVKALAPEVRDAIVGLGEDIQEQATAAEVQRRHSGVGVLLGAVGVPKQGTG